MQKEFIGKTKNGEDVYVDMEGSHAATHFADSPGLFDAVKRIIPTVEITEDHKRFEVDTGIIVGNSDLVETSDGDDIVYAMRPHRSRYSRFVKNKDPQPTSWITLDVTKQEDGSYNLYTAFIGRLTPSFPGGDFLPEQSHKFWAKHALAWGTQEVIPETETKDCPW